MNEVAYEWCVSCACGWHRPIDAYDVTPPEPVCRNPECECHKAFWWSVEGQEPDETMTRYAYGDR